VNYSTYFLLLVLLCVVAPVFGQTNAVAPGDNPEKIRSQLKVVEQLVAADRKNDALKELRSIAGEDLLDPQGFYNIGNAFARLGESDDAITAYRKAIAQRKGRYSRALNNLGVVLMREGRWTEASEALLSALRVENFYYAEASYNLGRLYALQGQRDLAVREWQRALRTDPDHAAARQALATGGRDYEVVAAPEPKREKTAGTRPETTTEPRREPVKSESVVRPRPLTSAKTFVVDPATFNDLQQARNARERGKDQEAVLKYRSVISRMGGYFAPANLELSYVLIELKQSAEALALLQAVTARDGARFPISYYHLARLYELNGDLVLAAKSYDQLTAYFKTSNPQFLLDVSRVREKQGDFNGALKALEEYLSDAATRGAKPHWSEERLAILRQKISAAQPKQ
jgi:tetratricopeptide (TPR) repeat protein